MKTSVDAAPLLAELERAIANRPLHHGRLDRTHAMVEALQHAVTRRTVIRWRHTKRIEARVADRCAIALGVHPLSLWPNLYRDPQPPIT